MWTPKSTLPISDLDNAHYKQKKSSMSRLLAPRNLRIVLGVLTGLGLLWVLFQYEGSTASLGAAPKASSKGATAAPGAAPAASDSFECARSFDGKKPVTQYVVMVDAGSSGSRVHIYEFNNCLEMPRLVREEFKMLEPGLSSFATDPQAAAASLDPLLKLAVETVPEKLRKCTPIAVKATAGLRKLGETGSAAILDAVKQHLLKEYPFSLIENGVEIMPGEDEGVYAWVTANYLLGRIGSAKKDPTVAVFDLGGGSTQIVFEPTFEEGASLSPGEHRFDLKFGGREFVLYQHSYLGYGLNEATLKMNSIVAKGKAEDKAKGDEREDIVSPCLPPGSRWHGRALVSDGTTTLDGPGMVEQEVTFAGPHVGSPVQCRAIADEILAKDAECVLPPCAFNGVYQPKLLDAFPRDSELYVFSFFYDRTFPLGMPNTFSLDDLKDLANKVCGGEEYFSSFSAVEGATKTLAENPQWCLHLNYMHSLLRTGYEIQPQREVKIAKKIAGNELGWCLGASLPLLDGLNWECRKD